MPHIAWSEDYSVGVPEIDAQHRRLVSFLNELHEAISAGREDDAIGGILSELTQYTRRHFATEERWMESVRYPGLAEHKAEHDRLTLQVVEYQANAVPGRLTISLDVLWFLWDWLQRHINESDKAIGRYAAAQQAAAADDRSS